MHSILRSSVVLLALALLVSACSRHSAVEFMANADDLAKKKKYDEAAAVYRQVIENYSNSDEAPAAYFWLGTIELNQQRNPAAAIATFNTLVERHPKSTWAHKALFTVGFTYANQLQDTDKARTAYEKYLQLYPDSLYAKDVKFELQNLGKTPEELLNMMKQDSTAQAAKK